MKDEYIEEYNNDKEYLDVVDRDGKFTGEVLDRKTIHDINLLHNEIGVFVVNNNKEILLQKRSKNKRYSPGKWGIVGGHVETLEEIDDAALRELNEEIGVEFTKKDLNKFLDRELFEDDTNSHFTYFYYIIADIDVTKSKYQKDEVEEVKWFSIEEIIDIAKSDDNFTTLNKFRIDLLEKLKDKL